MRLLFLVFLISCLGAATKSPLKLHAIKAQLIYQSSGTFSEDLITSNNFVYWNTIIGEGSAKEPTDKLLVMVQVKSSKKELNPKGEKILITVKENGKVKAESEQTVGFMTNFSYHVPLIVNNIGCEPLTITAKIKGDSLSLEKEIPFKCGE